MGEIRLNPQILPLNKGVWKDISEGRKVFALRFPQVGYNHDMNFNLNITFPPKNDMWRGGGVRLPPVNHLTMSPKIQFKERTPENAYALKQKFYPSKQTICPSEINMLATGLH